MSLLKAIEEAKAVVESLEALLGESVDKAQIGPWYLNIPKKGVECWIADNEDAMQVRMNSPDRIRKVVGYTPNKALPFTAIAVNTNDVTVGWSHAIPVDPRLRLPNGAITL